MLEKAKVRGQNPSPQNIVWAAIKKSVDLNVNPRFRIHRSDKSLTVVIYFKDSCLKPRANGRSMRYQEYVADYSWLILVTLIAIY